MDPADHPCESPYPLPLEGVEIIALREALKHAAVDAAGGIKRRIVQALAEHGDEPARGDPPETDASWYGHRDGLRAALELCDPPPDDAGYTVARARYAKGMMLVRCESKEGHTKTRAMRLLGALHGRWTNRERGYIMSPHKAEIFERMHRDGWDAGFMPDAKPEPPEVIT